MQFGAMNFPVVPVLDEIQTFARLGFDYIEIAMDTPMAHYSTLSSQQTDIKRALKDNGMGLMCHLPTFVSTADLTDSIRRASLTEMRRSLSVAADLGATKVVLHPSMVLGMGAFVIETVRSYAHEFLSEITTIGHNLEVTICLENMMPRNLLGVEPDDFEAIFRDFPSLRLTFDTGHANIDDRTGFRSIEFVERFGLRIGHLHFNDNFGARDDHLPVGRGTVKFSELIKSLKAINYDDTITLEVFDNNRQMLVESRDKIQKMFALL
jgi:sugar phosphate isomerase/epimerase